MSEETCSKTAFICSRGTLDGAYPSLVLSINSARLGHQPYVFCTFMGLNLVLKGGAAKFKFFMPGFVGAIPGMGLLATWMMKRQINKANIPSLEEMIEMCQAEGVQFVACHMTMGMRGLTRENLIDDVQIMTAEEYLKLAGTCSLNMFT